MTCHAARVVPPAPVDLAAFFQHVKLAGTCNLCGKCCTQQRDGETYSCQHLVQTMRSVGEPLATTCRVYGQRVDGMPITLLAPSGNQLSGVCAKGTVAEAAAILPYVGRGCSLTLEPSA